MSDTTDNIFKIQPKVNTSKQDIFLSSKEPTLPFPYTSIEAYLVDTLNKIERNTRKALESQKKKTNTHIHYYIDTSITTKRKIDIVKDIGFPASGLVIVSVGGGFNISINDEGYDILSSTNFQIVDEEISKIYVTGLGVSGEGRIRLGAWNDEL